MQQQEELESLRRTAQRIDETIGEAEQMISLIDSFDAPYAELYTDGASRGNPGDSSIGASLLVRNELHELQEVAWLSERLPEQTTNNVAEYTALIKGLTLVLNQRVLDQRGLNQRVLDQRVLNQRGLDVYSDSELLVKQINGVYQVSAAHLQPLYEQARELLGKFERATLRHIPREQNRRADQLANLALPRKKKKKRKHDFKK